MGSYHRCCRCGADAKTCCTALWDHGWWFWIKDAKEQWSSVLKRWEPMASWVQQQLDASSSEPTKIYCENCWKLWGRYVKLGCQYELSSSCEDLANKVGVEINDDDACHRQKSNPFKCVCDRVFNRGTLEAHMLKEHASSQQKCKSAGGQISLLPRFVTQPAPCERKRKTAETQSSLLDLGDHTETLDFPAFVHVSGAGSATARQSIQGSYAQSGMAHGKPFCKKRCQDACEVRMLIYYWDGRDVDSYQGWWFGPEVGSLEVWAYHETAVGGLPVSGWKVPWNGDVDNELKISMDAQPEKPLAVEGVWEFLSSEVGSAQDWQPMSYEVQKTLEERWTKGWEGDHGTDTFYVRANGYTYGIDCYCMLQWNVKTNRRRPIRRQQRHNVADLAQLVQQQQDLKEEIGKALAENAALTSKVADLEGQLLKLKAPQPRAEHVALMALQEPWRMGRHLDMNVRAKVPLEDGLFATLQESLVSACPADHHGDCNIARSLTITGLEQVHNIRLWKSYEFRKEQVKKELEGSPVPEVTSSFSGCKWAKLDPTVNEIWVLHGTTPDKVEFIANFGFDERLARQKGRYGQGVYFTDQTCKAFQYSGAGRQAEGCFIITRLILGEPHYASGPLPQVKVEPPRDPKDPSKGRCHSVIASPGTPSGNGAKQVHRELVIFNGIQAYPEMIVHIRK